LVANRLAVALIVVVSIGAASNPFAADHKQNLVGIEAMAPPRTGPQPMHAVRALSALQERIGAGDEAAFDGQSALAADIDRQLRALPMDVWKDARNRYALIKLALSGGNPQLLRIIAEKRLFAETEIALAHGALAYAEGHPTAALNYLDKVDCLALGPSLAGHVALIKAILKAETDPSAALALSDIARLLSPGTLVEESALRLAIELDIAIGERQRFEADVARYLRRFQRSKFAMSVVPQLAVFAAAHDYPGSAERKAWLERVSLRLRQDMRAELFVTMAEHGLRFGKLATVAYAARNAAASGADRALVLAYEGAALVISPNPTEGLELLAAADKFAPGAATNELIAVARSFATAIQAPPEVGVQPLPGQPPTTASAQSAQVARVGKAIAIADKQLQDTAQ